MELENSASLATYARKVHQLTLSKKWSSDWRWLVIGLVAEIGELVEAIIEGKSSDSIREEFTDVLHFLLELVTVTTDDKDSLDDVMGRKLRKNLRAKKKTMDTHGQVVWR